MTDDLVKCLRNRANGFMQLVTVEQMATEAANRIEQLEAALREICSIPAQKRGSVSYAMLVIAAAALGEKKDA
jgi:hypothetical protein